jgi:hypothetical protein
MQHRSSENVAILFYFIFFSFILFFSGRAMRDERVRDDAVSIHKMEGGMSVNVGQCTTTLSYRQSLLFCFYTSAHFSLPPELFWRAG